MIHFFKFNKFNFILIILCYEVLFHKCENYHSLSYLEFLNSKIKSHLLLPISKYRNIEENRSVLIYIYIYIYMHTLVISKYNQVKFGISPFPTIYLRLKSAPSLTSTCTFILRFLFHLLLK